MSVIVIMAEKANAAKDIAAAIGIEKIEKAAGGFLHGHDGDDDFVIVYSQGHCLRLQEPAEIDAKYEKWDLANLPIPFSDNELKEIDIAAAKRYGTIKAYLQKADVVINAGDAGREGELIQRWILKKSGIRKNVYRLWSSSLTKTAIKEAYDNLLGGNESEQRTLDNLYDAGAARAIMDKFMGYNYSRLISLSRTDGVTVNYGRCKSPLTHAIILRDEEIANFVKKPFSFVRIHMKQNGETFPGLLIGDNGKRIELDHAATSAIAASIKKSATVLSLRSEEKKVHPPKPYDILSIQKKMSEMYGYEADYTLEICQALYDEHKVLSYPRTDSRYLSTDLRDQVKDNLAALRFGEFAPFVSAALPCAVPARYFNDGKVTDHHALIPVVPESTLEKAYSSLSQDERNVFDEIAKSFISLFLPDCKYKETVVVLESGDHRIRATGKQILDPGFSVMSAKEQTDSEDHDEVSKIPDSLQEGETVQINDAEVIDTETKPKKHFTTASLLDYMKIHNIGTGATRDKIIKELTEKKGYNKNSSVRKEGKYYLATDFGKQMDLLIPEDLKSIEHLSRIDTKLKAIEEGDLTKREFLSEMLTEFEERHREMLASKEVILRNTKPEKEAPFDCPVCRQKLLDKGWGYACRNWQKDGTGCNYSIPKKIAGKSISDKVIGELLKTGKSKEKVKGFKSKSGTQFDAFLSYSFENGKADVRFDFNRKK